MSIFVVILINLPLQHSHTNPNKYQSNALLCDILLLSGYKIKGLTKQHLQPVTLRYGDFMFQQYEVIGGKGRGVG